MGIRSEDLDAIVTAVEMLIEGTLSTIHICRDGELIFSARDDGSGLEIDPGVMSPKLARHLLEHTALGGSKPPSEPNTRADDQPADNPETNTSPPDEDRPIPA